MEALAWQQGPTSGALEDKATIKVPQGARFLDVNNGSKFLELTGNLPSNENILVGETWWAAFSFNPAGYVKDDEKIDPDALLKDLKSSDEPGNQERRKRGMSELFTEGWYIPPHYDTATKHLEWALRLRASDSNAPIINYTVRLLGRSGYESAILVSRPETLETDVKSFKAALAGFDFNPGEKYSEFKSGDKIAEYGLAALVAGGAAAVAVKSGFWKVILGFLAAGWKIIAVGAVAVVGGASKLFKKKES
ncbi:Uncharacterized membrane-anchored protein [Rhodoferax sp. OV413]|nr:Uncharacterized membrane-anchored protein [Rhodoferax sp. OV413]